MKPILNFSLLFLFAVQLAQAQNDTLNKLDSAGKKNGTWLGYYDERLNEVKDSNKATYCRYTFFDHGKDLILMDFTGYKSWKLSYSGAAEKQKGRLKLMNGEYYWTDKKGVIRERNDFKDGRLLMQRSYFPSGGLSGDWDFTTLMDGQSYTFVVYLYNKLGVVSDCYWMEKAGEHWAMYGSSGSIGLDIDTNAVLPVVNGLKTVDTVGKRYGACRVYYDKNLTKVKDSAKATYYWNNEYINGFSNSWFAPPLEGDKLIRKSESNMESGKINALNGTYTWADKNGTIRLIQEFKNGYTVLYKRFEPDGKLSYIQYYNKEYKCLTNVRLIVYYNKDGTVSRRLWRRLYFGAKM